MSEQNLRTAEDATGHRPLFRFNYRTIPFDVRLQETEDGRVGTLEAVVGVLPFTVDGNCLRRNMLTVLDTARRSPGYGVSVGADHAIRLSVALPVDGETPPAGILAAAMERLAGAKALLDAVLLLQPPHLRKITGALSENAA